MLQEQVIVQDRIESGFPLVSPLTYVWYGEDVNTEILRVLERAADDAGFIAQLTDNGYAALQGYDLTEEAKAALLSGDIRWIEAHVGKLDARLRTWLDCRLQQEIW
jgi:hypothetical protein